MSATAAEPTTLSVEPDPRRWKALMVIAIAQLMVVLDASIVNIALPSIQEDLGISDANRQWVVTAYTLAFGGLLLLGGRIADFQGRKRMFIVGLTGFAFASFLGGISQTAEMLFAARALQGVFAALLAPAALSLISVTFTESHERAKAFGVFGAISGGGAAIGLVAGGILTEFFSWHWTLLVNVPIAIIAICLAIPFVKESRATGDTKYDVPGAIFATAGLVSLVYGITQANTAGWNGTTTLSFMGIGLLLLAIFLFIETRTSHPLLPLRILANRNRGGAYLASFFVGIGLFAMFLFLTYFFQAVLGYTPLQSGLLFLPFSAGVIISAGLASPAAAALRSPLGDGDGLPARHHRHGAPHHDVAEQRLRQRDPSVADHHQPRHGPGVRAAVGRVALRDRQPRRGRRIGRAEHQPADRWLDRRRVPQHRRGLRDDGLHRREQPAGPDAGCARRRVHPWLRLRSGHPRRGGAHLGGPGQYVEEGHGCQRLTDGARRLASRRGHPRTRRSRPAHGPWSPLGRSSRGPPLVPARRGQRRRVRTSRAR